MLDLNNIVKLVKKDGEIFEEIKAEVQPDLIIISNENLPIEEGDKIKRELSNGLVESYIVLDRGFYSDGIGGLGAHYQCEVEKESSLKPESKSSVEYNVYGDNSRINNNSVDNSTNIVNAFSKEIFNDLRKEIRQNIDRNDRILKAINEMESNQDDEKSFWESYQNFISLMGTQINLVSSYIPKLGELAEKLFE